MATIWQLLGVQSEALARLAVELGTLADQLDRGYVDGASAELRTIASECQSLADAQRDECARKLIEGT
jgi:hypothetical protein